jgi:hypothetical protein
MGAGVARPSAHSDNPRMWKTYAASIVLLSQITIATANAQLLDQLKGAMGSGQGGGALAVPSVNQASPSNIAGVLQYCVQNNYVSGGSATSVKDALVGKVTGPSHNAPDSQFQQGSNGVLDTGNGNNVSLGGGIKEQLTKKVCDLALSHAKSLL